MADKKKPPVGAEGQESACETERVMRDAKHTATPPAKVKPDTAAAIDFLRRFHPSTSWVLTAIIPDGKTETVTFDADRAEDAAAWIQKHQGKRGLYHHVNPVCRTLTSKASKTDIARLAWLHVDLDPVGEDLNAERERILKALQAFEPRPTVIIDSGGGFQGFWRLRPDSALETDGDVARAEALEAYNVQLERTLGADHCHDISRIMRIPGTVNVPNAKKRAKRRVPTLARLVTFDEAAVYAIERFQPARANVRTPEQRAPLRLGDGVARPCGTAELAAWAQEHGKTIPDATLALIATGADPVDAQRYSSRSEALFAACCGLVRSGVPDEMTFAAITDRNNGIAASVRDKPDWESYALRQIERANTSCAVPELLELNEKYCVIEDIGGKCRIVHEKHNRVLHRSALVKATFQDFINAHRNRSVQVGTNKNGQPVYKPLGTWWIDHPLRRQYASLVFEPGRDVEGDYNLWRGFNVVAAPGRGHESFLAHLRDTVCGADDDRYRYLLGWMARTVQRPDVPGEVAVVMRGGRGTGKSFFAKHYGHLFGRHYLQVSNAKHLFGQFNGHLRDAVLVFGDEAFYAGDKKHESVLKTLITEPLLMVESKGVDAEPAANYTHLIVASNEHWVVPAGVDERRFFVVEMSAAHQQDNPHFGAIAADLRAGGYANLLDYLLAYDLGAFDVRDVPQTTALRNQKEEGLKGFDAYLYELLQSGEIPGASAQRYDSDGKPMEVVREDRNRHVVARQFDGAWFVYSTPLADMAADWLRTRSKTAAVTGRAIELLMTKIGAWKGRKNDLNGYWWNIPELRAGWDREMFEGDWK